MKWIDDAVDCHHCTPEFAKEVSELLDAYQARTRELEAERGRWEARCEKAWKDLDKMGFQGLHEAFGSSPTHVIVPVAPTPEMIEAGQIASIDAASIRAIPEDVYRAMISAAQKEQADE